VEVGKSPTSIQKHTQQIQEKPSGHKPITRTFFTHNPHNADDKIVISFKLLERTKPTPIKAAPGGIISRQDSILSQDDNGEFLWRDFSITIGHLEQRDDG